MVNQRTRSSWVGVLRKGAARRLDDLEKARRRAESARLLAFRDSLPSIAPDTTAEYVRQIRQEEVSRR